MLKLIAILFFAKFELIQANILDILRSIQIYFKF